MRPDLAEQHRHLDPSEADATLGLGYRHRAPALIGHGGPELGVVGLAAVEMGAHLGRARVAVEQVPRALLQRSLVGGQIEIHGVAL